MKAIFLAPFVALLLLAGCATQPGQPAPSLPHVDLSKVDPAEIRAAIHSVADGLIPAADAALTLRKWTDAQKADIAKAKAALIGVRDALAGQVQNVDLRQVTLDALAAANVLLPLLDLDPKIGVPVTAGMALLKAVVTAMPPKDPAASPAKPA